MTDTPGETTPVRAGARAPGSDGEKRLLLLWQREQERANTLIAQAEQDRQRIVRLEKALGRLLFEQGPGAYRIYVGTRLEYNEAGFMVLRCLHCAAVSLTERALVHDRHCAVVEARFVRFGGIPQQEAAAPERPAMPDALDAGDDGQAGDGSVRAGTMTPLKLPPTSDAPGEAPV